MNISYPFLLCINPIVSCYYTVLLCVNPILSYVNSIFYLVKNNFAGTVYTYTRKICQINDFICYSFQPLYTHIYKKLLYHLIIEHFKIKHPFHAALGK